jgi:predicted kinase
MKTVILLCGIPGSGKSTWAKAYQKTHPNTFICDTDETRKKITGSYNVFPPRMEMIFDDLIQQANAIFAREKGDCTVIEDAAFLDDYRRKYFMDRLHGYDHSILLMAKMHDYRLCYERNKMREEGKWVPDSVIDGMLLMYKDPAAEVAKRFDEIKTIYLD